VKAIAGKLCLVVGRLLLRSTVRPINLTGAHKVDYREIGVARYIIQLDRNTMDIIQTQNAKPEILPR